MMGEGVIGGPDGHIGLYMKKFAHYTVWEGGKKWQF
jgi:hypothetical protein